MKLVLDGMDMQGFFRMALVQVYCSVQVTEWVKNLQVITI